MPRKNTKVSLIYFVILTLFLVGLVPLVLTGWFLSEKSANELRTVENRYQIQLVQEKARQIEMFGQRYTDVVKGIASSLSLASNADVLSRPETEQKFSSTLRDNPDLLAIYIIPIKGESLVLYRPDTIGRSKIDNLANQAVKGKFIKDLYVGASVKDPDTKESLITFASPVNINGSPFATAVTIVSLTSTARSVVGMEDTEDSVLWSAGLPIIFAVDDKGHAIFHPDETYSDIGKNLADLKIVEEWLEANEQIQSGLLPFTAVKDESEHTMIGAYSTVSIGGQYKIGIITMQDESRALASVTEMRTQTWLISLIFAMVALAIGIFAARSMASPILKLSAAAEKIAAGDLTTRVETRNITEIGALGRSFNIMSDKLEEHIARLAHAAQENRELFVGTVKALAAAIDGKDKYTRGHSERVARISVAIATQMGLATEEIEKIRISALLHDIGKIAIDDNILKKPAALTTEEFEIMKTHPEKGYKIMSQIPAMKDFLPGMYMHHEMVNGKGYPQGLTDKQIPLQAKIISVADTFDAMTIDRPYSKGMLLPDALVRIKELVGTRYDAEVVKALETGCASGVIGRGVVQKMAAKSTEIENAQPVNNKPVNNTQANQNSVESSNLINNEQRTSLPPNNENNRITGNLANRS